ncbi:hypothetical protein [Nocardia jiangsuensis]|uniref:Uncharacterized protein n=1 Tax=Nocardia jiangsuensis TaxID=1691563 RepID=A0ABV8DUM0_9NOCA
MSQPENPSLDFKMFDMDDLNRGIGEYIEHIDGPVSRRLAQRDSLEKLIALSKSRTLPKKAEVVLPSFVRGTVVALLSDKHVAEAASLMDWYLGRETFHFQDSLERVRAFELVLRERFDDYAEVRGR